MSTRVVEHLLSWAFAWWGIPERFAVRELPSSCAPAPVCPSTAPVNLNPLIPKSLGYTHNHL